MKESKLLRKNKDVVTRVIDDEAILMPVYKSSKDINCIYTLNKPAWRVWELIDGKRDIDCIKKQLCKEFDSAETQIDKKLKKIVSELKSIKAVV